MRISSHDKGLFQIDSTRKWSFVLYMGHTAANIDTNTAYMNRFLYVYSQHSHTSTRENTVFITIIIIVHNAK